MLPMNFQTMCLQAEFLEQTNMANAGSHDTRWQSYDKELRQREGATKTGGSVLAMAKRMRDY